MSSPGEGVLHMPILQACSFQLGNLNSFCALETPIKKSDKRTCAMEPRAIKADANVMHPVVYRTKDKVGRGKGREDQLYLSPIHAMSTV